MYVCLKYCNFEISPFGEYICETSASCIFPQLACDLDPVNRCKKKYNFKQTLSKLARLFRNVNVTKDLRQFEQGESPNPDAFFHIGSTDICRVCRYFWKLFVFASNKLFSSFLNVLEVSPLFVFAVAMRSHLKSRVHI